jgi:hypothetical protein
MWLFSSCLDHCTIVRFVAWRIRHKQDHPKMFLEKGLYLIIIHSSVSNRLGSLTKLLNQVPVLFVIHEPGLSPPHICPVDDGPCSFEEIAIYTIAELD